MALKIADTCINCGVCEFACPNEAISEGKVIYEIARDRCTECIGHFKEPQCQELCPIDECITIDLDYPETHDQLLKKYKELTHDDTNAE
jgi:ferredoxin